MSRFIDRAQLSALAGSSGTLPAAADQETASEYGRLLGLIPDPAPGSGQGAGELKKSLEDELGRWDAAVDARLAAEPLSASLVESLRTSVREALNERQRVSERIPATADPAESPDDAGPVLGMNVRVPRRSFVDGAISASQADPGELGRMIAGAFTDAEDRAVVARLRALQHAVLAPTAPALRDAIEAVRDAAESFVLLTRYGGFGALDQRYPADVTEALDRVTCIETGALDVEAILFDVRSTLSSSRRPEERDGLSPVEGTSIALGVFDDGDGRAVRVEAGENFLIRAGGNPRVFRLGAGAGARDTQRR